jgi:hypothetical protein
MGHSRSLEVGSKPTIFNVDVGPVSLHVQPATVYEHKHTNNAAF